MFCLEFRQNPNGQMVIPAEKEFTISQDTNTTDRLQTQWCAHQYPLVQNHMYHLKLVQKYVQQLPQAQVSVHPPVQINVQYMLLTPMCLHQVLLEQVWMYQLPVQTKTGLWY